MHDRRKVKEEIDEATRERNRIDVNQFVTLYDSILKQRREGVYTEAVLEQLTDIMRKNPEAYSMYNYRREVLLHLWAEAKRQGQEQKEQQQQQQQRDSIAQVAPSDTMFVASNETDPLISSNPPLPSAVRRQLEWLKEELKLSSSILIRDYKVYAAFVHRRWIFAQLHRLAEESMVANNNNNNGACSGSTNRDDTIGDFPEEVKFWADVLLKEKKQCDALLAIDERNFHAWNYRRWALGEFARMKGLLAHLSLNVSGLHVLLNEAKKSDDNEEKLTSNLFLPEEMKEFCFTTEMIRRNFSNYSAWHQRGLLLRTAVYRLSEQHRQGHLQTDSAITEFWAQLHEDLSLVTTAVYCDPVDQSAWYYAQFLQRAADMLRQISSTCTCVDVTSTLVDACLELVVEERRLGEDAEVHWPHLYLLNVLLSEVNENTDCGSDMKYNGATAAKVRAALFPDSPDEDDRARCLRGLREHLITADPLRAGMYHCLVKEGK